MILISAGGQRQRRKKTTEAATATGLEGTESVPIMTEAGTVLEEVGGDIPTTAELEAGDGTFALVSAEAAPLLVQEGDSSMVEEVLPQDKGKGVAISKGGLHIRSTYGREHVDQRPSKGWLSRF